MTDLFLRALPLLQQAIVMTLGLGLGAFVLGSILGMLVALMRNAKLRSLRILAFAYVSIFRGTPVGRSNV